MRPAIPAVIVLVLLAGCSREPAGTVWFHLPHPTERCHLRVTIDADGTYAVTRRFRSATADDPRRGVHVRTGTVDRVRLDSHLGALVRMGLAGVDQAAIEQRMIRPDGSRTFIADGGDFAYAIDTTILRGRFALNAVPVNAREYPAIRELRLLVKAMEALAVLADELWEAGAEGPPPGKVG